MRYNRQYKDIYKIAQTILFFLEHDMQYFGRVKLMKLLFYADKYHLEKYKKTIFNTPYTKLRHGPVPESTNALLGDALSLRQNIGYSLEYEEEAKIINHYLEIKTKLLSNNNKMYHFQANDNIRYDKDFLSISEIEILENVVDEFKTMNTEDISELSHKTRAWKSVDMRQPISLYNMVDNMEDRKFINYLYKEKTSFGDNFGMYKVEQ